MSRPASPLAAVIGPCREPDPAAARRAARDAYHHHGIVLINPDWLPGQGEREILTGLADQVHGPRGTAA